MLIASAKPPGDLEGSRWPFLARRVMQTHAPGSSHGEIVDPDAYAMTFWYDAALVILLDEPYAIDFVRHRAEAGRARALEPLADSRARSLGACRDPPPPAEAALETCTCTWHVHAVTTRAAP